MRIPPVVLCLLFAAYVPTILHAQFSGNAGLGITTYRNAEGTDTSSGDRAFTPELSLAYDHKFSPISKLEFSSFLGYDLYVRVPDRSYLILSLGTEFETYLSNLDAIRQEAKGIASAVSSYPEIAAKLTSLADSTLTLRTAVERTALKQEAISDIQSDVAATLIAYAALLEEMGLTQSFRDVLVDELQTIKNRTSLFGTPAAELATYHGSIDSLSALLKTSLVESDFNLGPSVPTEETELADSAPKNGLASLITLLLTNRSLEQFSYSRFYPKYYLSTASATTYATELSVPLELDRKAYRPLYDSYSYTSLQAQPRIEFYPSRTFGVGVNYLFRRSKFAGTSLYTFNEHAARVDGRLELNSFLCLVGEFSIGRRSYPNPMSITDTIRFPRFRTVTYTAPHNYTRLSPAIGAFFFPSERIALAIAGRLTRNPADSLIYLGGVSLRQTIASSSYFGLASDESYIYEAGAISGALSILFPAEIEFGGDVMFESRAYPQPPLPKLFTTRSDDVVSITGSISKYFTYSRRALGFISSIYPRISFVYTDLQSTLNEFSYSDLSFSAGISIGF